MSFQTTGTIGSARCSTARSDARERDYYAFLENGVKNLRAKQWLATVEQNVALIVEHLRDVGYVLTPAEKEWVEIFVGRGLDFQADSLETQVSGPSWWWLDWPCSLIRNV